MKMCLCVARGSLLISKEPDSLKFVVLRERLQKYCLFLHFVLNWNCFLDHRKVWNIYVNEGDRQCPQARPMAED